MSDQQVDVVVIGMGPGGEDVAGRLAEAGLSVVGIDSGLVGGECPYWGCIPSKMMIRAANLLAEARRIPGVAGASAVTPDWGPLATRIRDEATADWDDAAAVQRFEGKGGRFVRGRGRIVAPGRVEVGDEVFAAGLAIVLASGTTPSVPPIDGLADTPHWTNHEAIEATEVPARLVVLGAGAVGAELAQVFARFGSDVTVVEAADRLLPAEEPEAGDLLAEAFAAEGIITVTGVGAERVSHDDDGFVVTLADGTEVRADRLLVATGRRADPSAVGAEVVGVAADSRSVPVDEHLRVADGVWAVGDITGKGPFTHVAMYQSAIAVADILGEPHAPADYKALPRVTFTDPEIGSVGRSEADARDAGLTVAVGSTPVPSTARGWIHGPGNDGFIKLVADADRGVLVGATSAGPVGGEVLGLLVLAVHAEVPLATLRTMIYAYPTFHRGVEDALRDLEA
ncbi:NAD(P)/FAD-dependent oxidoreductase [Iamia sp.]|uniref:dihydrolipoyl dehydrogenase family protein n=1 Tax=Iamia sp. TaxID=2722710 RepID=UPI002B8C8488|nr:NAD(P)/FAD-dependent oxidoreductase [Iamia sp.]HXH57496.1 NAD(P)/FAD-dependent oxidoreductase [Iamia sp.]